MSAWLSKIMQQTWLEAFSGQPAGYKAMLRLREKDMLKIFY